VKDLVHPKEKQYYRIALVFSMIVYALVLFILFSTMGLGRRGLSGIAVLFVLALYGFLIWAGIAVFQGYFVARIRKNAVKIGERQFGEVHAMVKSMAAEMGMAKVPEVYLLEAGGALNAFATKLFSRDFVVIYSDIFELAYGKGEDALRFVIAHELGHVHRKHLRGRWKILPGFVIPFLAMAYSRACELTCDRYGKAYGKPAGNQGLLLLAAGKELYEKANEEEIVRQLEDETGFFMWLAEVNATHPGIARRVKHFREYQPA
jgi:Zn-dependent protease with chaperone function